MSLLIDGYNLLHATGIFGRGNGRGSLERSRRALLNCLAASLSPDVVARTTVVFDAKECPPGLPSQVSHRGINVLFSRDYVEADELLEELIRKDSAPREMTVVSSDHRIQRAARRRKASAVDSDQWYAEVLRQRAQRNARAEQTGDRKPTLPLSDREVDAWLAEFGDVPPDEQDGISDPFPPGYGEDLLE